MNPLLTGECVYLYTLSFVTAGDDERTLVFVYTHSDVLSAGTKDYYYYYVLIWNGWLH